MSSQLFFRDLADSGPVSYTHLDVYKRQLLHVIIRAGAQGALQLGVEADIPQAADIHGGNVGLSLIHI